MFKALTSGLVLFLIILAGCSGKPVDESDPGALFKEAEEEFSSDHFQVAIDKFRVVKNKFPYSKFSADAQLRIADVYFAQESFTEAATAYETFRDLHPKHEKTPYAMFRIAKSYFNDIPGHVARDLTPAQKSLEAYNDFLKQHGSAPEAAEAKKDVAQVRNILADKELYIGDFYFKRDAMDSAILRYKKVLELYPETPAAITAKAQIQKAEHAKP